ncbi:MAG: hypothetical protein M0011_08595 [Elusimicrobia bacterium]|nr:hypothetical protein [Elusimicrobiota bacterium]
MSDGEHKSLFLTRKVLALLPLLLLGGAVWYFVQVRRPAQEAASVPAGAKIFGQAAPSAAGATPEAPASPAPAEAEGEGVAAARIPDAYDPRAGLDIQGSAEFKRQVTNALKLIWSSDRDTFLFIRRNLYVIRSENKTGFYMENGVPVAAMSDAQAYRSVTWCAGIIAHQAWHAAYAMSRRRKTGGKVPPPGQKSDLQVEANPMVFDYKALDSVLAVEDKAFSFQLDVLRKAGAPRSETDPVFRRAPRDFFLAHDGSYSVNP